MSCEAMINPGVAAKKSLLILVILTSLLCSLSGGLRLPMGRGEAKSDSAVRPTRTSLRTDALINAQNVRAEVHLAKPKSAKYSASHGAAPDSLDSLSASARLFIRDENPALCYFSQCRIPPRGRAPPNFN